MLCDALGAAVAKEDTALRAAIPVRQRVAVCVWRLATGELLCLVVLFNGRLLVGRRRTRRRWRRPSEGELTATALRDGTRFQRD